MKRTAFFISDGTGITAETLGEALLSQFDGIEFRFVRMPYVDTEEKAHSAVQTIDAAARRDGLRPVVFETVIDPRLRAIIAASEGRLFDIFGTFLRPLEQTLDASSSFSVGRYHGQHHSLYHARIDAVHYAMTTDDGAAGSDYTQADVILVGVSRSGKTPSCIYLAMQFGVRAANCPLTEDDFDHGVFPGILEPYRDKLFGLTIDPKRLCGIRQQRRPRTRYASLHQCEAEVRDAENMFLRDGIPFLDTTRISVEEIATRVLMLKGISVRRG